MSGLRPLADEYARRKRESRRRAREAILARTSGGGEATAILRALHPDHDGQARVRREAGRKNVLYCGRQWGKTDFGVRRSCERALAGKKVGYFTPESKYLAEVFRDLSARLEPAAIKCDRSEMRIEVRGGGVVEAWTLKHNPNAGRGRTYDEVIYEEAGLITKGVIGVDLKEHWSEVAQATLLARKGIAWFNGTPKPRGYFNTIFQFGQRGVDGWRSWRMPTVTNPTIDPAEIDRIRAEYEREGLLSVFRQEYEAIPMEDLGAPFAGVADCLVPLSSLDPCGWGWDLAEQVDHTIGIALDRARHVCRFVDTQREGRPDWDEIEDVVFATTGALPAEVDMTGVGKAPVESLVKRFTAAGRVDHEGESLLRGVLFSESNKQLIYGGIRRAIRRHELGIPDGPIADALAQAEYAISDSDKGAGPGVKIWVPRGYAKDVVDALGLAIRARERFELISLDRYPALRDYSDDEIDAQIAAEDALEAELEREIEEDMRRGR